MKKFLAIFAVAGLMTACNNADDATTEDTTTVVTPDTTTVVTPDTTTVVTDTTTVPGTN